MQDTYNPKEFEQRIYERWIKDGCFTAKVKKGEKKFSIVLPPPNITGQLHLGHAMNITIPDAIVRFKRMQGFNTLWVPGYDHASIATEMKIVEQLKADGKTKEQVGREEFLRLAEQWKETYGGRIINQIRRMGFSLDWTRMSYTMDERCSKAVRETFCDLYEKGLIYRGNRITTRCTVCNTAISDAEVEYVGEKSHLWHLRYPFADGNGYIVVATTRPETMLGDTAVAVNPKDKRYKGMEGKRVRLPLTDRTIPIVYDDYVDKEFGTGAVKITPAHDPNDFEVGIRHNLDVIKVIDDRGIMNENAFAYKGLNRFDARDKIVADLQANGLMEKIEDHEHNVGHCYRCHSTVEPMVSKQWYVKMADLAKPAIDAVKSGKIKFVPKRFEKGYFNWMNNIRDWCISRQLWWGHRIPIYTCDDCATEFCSRDTATVCPKCGSTHITQDPDVLDTWFSSALWPFSTMGWPDKTDDLDYFYPTDLLVTAYDIITFWVSRMIVMGYNNTGKAPFKDVYIHGLVRDNEGRKMSKSSGNGVDPLVLCDEGGVDALRFTLVNGIARGGDTCFSHEAFINYRNFMNKLHNAAKFVLNACKDGYDKTAKPNDVDKWLLHRLNEVTVQVTRAYEKYDVGHGAFVLYEFVRNEFCDWYIEFCKRDLADESRKSATAGTLLHAFKTILKLLHPVIPFVTTELYDALPDREGELMLLPFPKAKRDSYAPAAKRTERLIEAVRAVRNLKHTNEAIAKCPDVFAESDDFALIARYLPKLAKTNALQETTGQDIEKCALVALDGVKLYLPLQKSDAEYVRLQKELDEVNFELNLAQSKLSNKGFAEKAPQKLIDAEKEKVKKYLALKAAIAEKLANLKA